MADDSTNLFDQFDPDLGGSVPAPSGPASPPANDNSAETPNIFDQFDPEKQPEAQTSGTGAFIHGAERGIIPAVGGMAGAGAGATIGAAIGAPFAGVGAIPGAVIGGVIGGIAGGFGGTYVASSAQDIALKALPDSWKDAIGQSDEQQALDIKYHPTESFLGGLLPFALTMRPGGFGAAAALPENATTFQRIAANPVTARIFGGALMGGMELGNELAGGQNPNWTNIAISTGFGVVFNKPYFLGERLTELGAGPVRSMLGIEGPRVAETRAATAAAEAPKAPAEPFAPGAKAVINDMFEGQPGPDNGKTVTIVSPSKDGSGYMVRYEDGTEAFTGKNLLGAAPEAKPVTPEPEPPTVAQAGDAKVMGPGVTEDVFMGSHEQAPDAAMTAQDAARTEASVLNPEAGAPDVHAIARRMEPDLLNEYDALTQQHHDLSEHLANIARDVGAESPEAAAMRQQIMATDAAMRDIAPQVSAAYRRAADAGGHETIEPETAGAPENAPTSTAEAPTNPLEAPIPGTEATPTVQVARPIEAQVASIAEDVTRQLIAAGRPEAEARAAGQLLAQRYRTRSARLGNPLGAEALYRSEGPTIRAPGRKAPLMPTAEQPQIVPENIPRNIPAPITEENQAVAAPEIAHEIPGTPSVGAHASELESLDPATIGVDAERFQFKAGSDEAGVSERLQGVEKWDPRLAGTALVYRDAEGKNWIADGHQRLGLAKRLSETQPGIRLNAFVLDAATGITDSQARAIAAVKNIAEGTGSAVDAAKVLREAKDSGIDLPPLPPRSTLVRDGRALAELSPEAFGMVINDVIPANQGAMVGRLVRDPAQQAEAVRLLSAAKPENAVQAEMMIRDMLASGTEMTKQESLFGEEAFASSIVLERAKVAEEALKQLRRDKTTFRTLVNEAERIEGQGANVLDQAANTSRLTTDEKAADLLTQLAFRAGPVSDQLSAVSRRLKAGEISTPQAARDFLGVVRGAVEAGVDTGADAGGAVTGAAGERGLEPPDPNQTEFFQRSRPDLWEPGEMFGGFETERGLEGLPQTLIPGVKPLTDAERMAQEAARPLKGKSSELPGEGSLFDTDAGKQPELFQEKRGSITFAEGRKPLIKLFQEADASTFIHETGHQWLEELMRDAVHPQADNIVKDDAQTVRDWLGIGDIGETIKTKQHEKFARGFEQYVREGVAPSPGLARVFSQFKQWLTTIYQSLKGLGAPISDDIKAVFDRMIAEEPNRTVVAPEREGAEPSLSSIHEAEAAETHPAHAEPVGDRIIAERDAYIAQQPPEIQNELAAAVAATEPAPVAGAEGGAGATGGPEVVAGSGEPQPVAPSGGSGGEPGAVISGGVQGMERGAGTQTGGAGAAGGSTDAGLRDVGPGAAGAARAQPLAPDPGHVFGAETSPFLDKAGNIRVENLTTNEDVAKAIHDAADANNDFIGERRGVITDGQVLDLADALGMDAAQLSKRKIGEAFNAEQVIAARKLLIQSATDVSAAMKKLATSGSDADAMAYAQIKARHQMIQGQVSGLTAEAGRALRAFRTLVGQEQAVGVDQFIRNATAKTLFQLKEEAKLGAMLGTPQEVSKFMADSKKRSFSGMLLEYWINGLVSGPRTHVTNAIGNMVMSMQVAGPETAAAAVIGAVRKSLGREGTTVRLGEVGAHMRGAVSSLPSATKAAVDALRSGRSIALPGEEVKSAPYESATAAALSAHLDESATYADIAPDVFGLLRGTLDGLVAIGKLVSTGGERGSPLISAKYSPLGQIPDVAIRGTTVLPIGTALRLPTRFLAAGDSFFRAANYSMKKSALAYRSAADRGLTGTAFDSHVAATYMNPSPELMEEARGLATELTFMSRRSDFVNALTRLANVNVLGLPIMKFIVPFIGTPANIIEQTVIHRTPVGLFSPEIRADLAGKNGNVSQDTAMARMLVGSAYAIGFGALAARGLMTGSGPTDPNKRALWRLAGNQPHSVRIGDMFYDVRTLGPVGMLSGIASDLYDVSHAAEQGDIAEVGNTLLHAFMQNILDASFMKGPSDLIQALEDPGRYGQSYVKSYLSSFVPFSGATGQVARSFDPYTRDARSVVDSVKAKVPGLSETLFPRRDIWGNPLPSGTALGSALFSSVYTTQVSKDPVNQAMLQTNYWPGTLDRKIRGVALTDEQYDQFSMLAGRMAKSRLDQIVRSPDWQSWPASTRHDVVQETILQSRETARGIMMGRYPSIVAQATSAKLAGLH